MKVEIILAIIKAAKVVKISPVLLLAVCFNESSYRNIIHPDDGHHHSYGLMQVQLRTAREFEKSITAHELMDIQTNALIGAKYLKRQIKRYSGNVDCAVNAYNKGSAYSCGEAVYVKRVKRFLKIKPWRKWYKGPL